MRLGLILLAHGAKDSRWREPFERLVARIAAKRPELGVRLAFLELMTPDLVVAGEQLVAGGCDALHVVPLFLGQGGHVREDVPVLVDTLRQRCPGIPVTQSHAVGEDAGVLDALASFCVEEVDAAR